MYFKRLELFGFKSFAEKTLLQFEPGITAIVGPNGCGKSNIFDAIRWALGEQGIKDLRAGAMEDVIFNGTDKKPALGFAEVSLTFSNEPKMLPIEYNEVTVTRRLFRSGESEYLLNKTAVRLKDVVELFMGTGIGAEAYSLVQQGRVDLVVNSHPEDRRLLLDEASGITKYKSKKKEALNKLKETEDNLLRLNDIILEVKRQIGSLERQATKARRYKEEFEKLKDLEIILARQQIEDFRHKAQEIQQALQELKTQESQAAQQLEEGKAEATRQSHQARELEEKITGLHANQMRVDTTIEIHSRQIEFHQERLENLSRDEARLNEKHTQLRERSREKQKKNEELKGVLANLKNTLAIHWNSLQEKKEALTKITATIAEEKVIIHQEEERLLALTAGQVKLKNELTEILKDSQGSRARYQRLESETTKIAGEKEQSDDRLLQLQEQISVTSQKIQGLKSHEGSLRKEREVLKLDLGRLNTQKEDSERKKLFFVSQKAFIEKLGNQYQDMPEPILEGSFIASLVPSLKQRGMISKIKEILPLAETKAAAWVSAGTSSQRPLYELVCETKFIEWDPQELTPRIQEIDRHLESLSAQKETQILTLNQKEDELQACTQSLHEEEKTSSILEVKKSDLQEGSNKLIQELQLISTETKELQDLLAQLKAKEDALSRELEAVTHQLQMCQKEIQQRQKNIMAQSHSREETTITIAQLETETASLKDKEDSQIENLKLFAESWEADLQEIQRLEEESHQDLAQRQKIQESIQEMLNQIELLKSQRGSHQDLLKDCEKQKADGSGRLEGLNVQIGSLEKKCQGLRDALHQQEMKNQEISFGEKAVKDRLSQLYKVDFDHCSPADVAPTAVLRQQDVGAPTPKAGEQELSGEIERLKKRCESYGAVNLVAIEEFDQLKERFEFLTKQQSDLLTAKESLHQTIAKINRTAREMFVETFAKVSEEFRSYFRMLFGGGEAQLILLEPENELESGIEITVRPPGKRLQNIGLLSGGEKTLTAIALIFAVLKVRPSPFCVLDEVDAALDESNVGRFSYLLKDFAKTTQFIVITHNKKTLTHADILYGITMQEKGISKIVSVKFAEERKTLPQEVEVAAVS